MMPPLLKEGLPLPLKSLVGSEDNDGTFKSLGQSSSNYFNSPAFRNSQNRSSRKNNKGPLSFTNLSLQKVSSEMEIEEEFKEKDDKVYKNYDISFLNENINGRDRGYSEGSESNPLKSRENNKETYPPFSPGNNYSEEKKESNYFQGRNDFFMKQDGKDFTDKKFVVAGSQNTSASNSFNQGEKYQIDKDHNFKSNGSRFSAPLEPDLDEIKKELTNINDVKSGMIKSSSMSKKNSKRANKASYSDKRVTVKRTNKNQLISLNFKYLFFSQTKAFR
jgi:hypothetical protein